MSYWGSAEEGTRPWVIGVVLLASGWVVCWAVLGGHMAAWVGGVALVGLVAVGGVASRRSRASGDGS